MKSRVFQTTVGLQAIGLAAAIFVTAPASAAWAQGGQAASGAAASKPGGVRGVVVKPPAKAGKVPPEKKKVFDAEAAKRQAWTSYRRTTPTATMPPTATETATGTATSPATARAENYPGLRSAASH